jgi:hypothetical protein
LAAEYCLLRQRSDDDVHSKGVVENVRMVMDSDDAVEAAGEGMEMLHGLEAAAADTNKDVHAGRTAAVDSMDSVLAR